MYANKHALNGNGIVELIRYGSNIEARFHIMARSLIEKIPALMGDIRG